MALEQSIKYGERYTSVSLNRKLSGILPAGVYFGYNIKPAGGRSILLEKDPEYPAANVAIVDRDGYSITVTAKENEIIPVPAIVGDYYVCIQAAFIPEQAGEQQIVFRSAPEEHHVVLGKLSLAAGVTEITEAMITEEGRTVGNPLSWLVDMTTRYVNSTTDILDLQHRMTNIENWAKTKGYNPSTTYSAA